MELYDLDIGNATSSRDNWLRIQRNDPSLRCLEVYFREDSRDDSIIDDAEFGENAEFGEMGRDIGKNSHLQELEVNHGDYTITDNHMQQFQLLCEGINQNRSIKVLRFIIRGKIYWNSFQCLALFLESNSNLQSISVDTGPYSGFALLRSLVASLVRRGSPLDELDLAMNDDESVEEFFVSLQDDPAMTPKKLSLTSSSIIACISIAALLHDPRCTMEVLHLFPENGDLRPVGYDYGSDTFQNVSSFLIANALVSNTSLKEFKTSFPCNRLPKFSKSLCNPKSIHSTYNSNHTLQVLASRTFTFNVPSDLQRYLSWNRNDNKKMVARRKVFIKHFFKNINTVPFNDEEPELLVRFLGVINEQHLSLWEHDENEEDNHEADDSSNNSSTGDEEHLSLWEHDENEEDNHEADDSSNNSSTGEDDSIVETVRDTDVKIDFARLSIIFQLLRKNPLIFEFTKKKPIENDMSRKLKRG